MDEIEVEKLKKSTRGNRAKIATIDEFTGHPLQDYIRGHRMENWMSLLYLFDDYPPIDEEVLKKVIEPLINNK